MQFRWQDGPRLSALFDEVTDLQIAQVRAESDGYHVVILGRSWISACVLCDLQAAKEMAERLAV